MKNILLPTDFSENSWNAIKYALHLFKDEKCNFQVLNTYTPAVYHEEYLLSNPSRFSPINFVKEVSEKGLNDIVKRIGKEFNNPNHLFTKISSFNTLLMEIKELQEDATLDLIVMGTKGASGLKEILVGSNTVHVIKSAKCPVLAIPENFPFYPPVEMLFPTDYEVNFGENHLKPIIDIASLYQSQVNIMNVSYGYNLSYRQEENKELLVDYLKNTNHYFHSLSNQTVPEAISNFMRRTNINLLVMIKNKHSFFEKLFFKSKIDQIGFHLDIPFLVIPSML